MRKDERGVVIPAPMRSIMGGLPRYDDEHRGPAVIDAYQLSRCSIDLKVHSEGWPTPEDLSPRMVALAANIPSDQRENWLRTQANLEEAHRLIANAIRSGDLPIWVAPFGEGERLVAPDALIEIDGPSITSGIYRPPNDRGWLYGRPLFVKKDDWVRFKDNVQAAKGCKGARALDGAADTANLSGQVSVLSAQAALPRYPGDPNKGWIELLDAFEVGTVRTSISQRPPAVADDLLNRHDVATPAWWAAYSRDLTRANAPIIWADWFRGGGILVDVADLREHVRCKLEDERRFFSVRRRRGRGPNVWTDVETWAWIATRDRALTDALGDFVRVEFQNPSSPEYARQMAIEYLQFRLREGFCTCGAQLAFVEPDKCRCSEASWFEMVEALQDGRLTATTANHDGMQLPVSPEAFRGAVYDMRLRKFLLTGANCELLFDRREVELRFLPERTKSPAEQNPGPLLWEDFDPDDLPELQRLCDLALQDEWWTWPEAITWTGGRNIKNIATLRLWGREWPRRSGAGPAETFRMQGFMANQYCNLEREPQAALLNAIERGSVGTLGRENKSSAADELKPSSWRGGTVVYQDGQAVLVDARYRLTVWAHDVAVSRKDLMASFPAIDEKPVQESTASNRKRPGPAPDPDWPIAIAHVTQACKAAGYKRPLKRGDKAAIQTMLLNFMADKGKVFSDDAAAKHAQKVIADLPDK